MQNRSVQHPLQVEASCNEDTENRSGHEMVRKGALPGYRIHYLVHAQLKDFSSLPVGDRDYVLLILKYAVKLNESIATNHQAINVSALTTKLNLDGLTDGLQWFCRRRYFCGSHDSVQG